METDARTYIIIPAFEPDSRMLDLIDQLKQKTEYEIVIVNDGSGHNYNRIFNEAGKNAHVIAYPENHGKGYALKTAFRYLLSICSRDCLVITADADGQHSAEDILCVADSLRSHMDSLVLGSRRFSGKVPFKSRAGNAITRNVFRMSTGIRLQDTQTGLRAFSARYLDDMIHIDGNRYEYEINVLLKWMNERLPYYEETIETIYLENNASSHFHPVRDSFLIYREILKFTLSSFISFLADYALYALFILLTGTLSVNISVPLSNISARVLSAALNYSLNRRFVFRSRESIKKTAFQYMLLAASILLMNTLLLTLLVNTIVPNRFIAKILVEISLFIFSCTVQKKMIFRKKSSPDKRILSLRKAVIEHE